MPGVFAAGDIVRGACLVVWAIRDGRDAAAEMHAWLRAAGGGAGRGGGSETKIGALPQTRGGAGALGTLNAKGLWARAAPAGLGAEPRPF